MHAHACASTIKEQKQRFKLCAATPKQHATACAKERKMYHPTMLRPFARDLSSEKEKEKFLSCVDVHKT